MNPRERKQFQLSQQFMEQFTFLDDGKYLNVNDMDRAGRLWAEWKKLEDLSS